MFRALTTIAAIAALAVSAAPASGEGLLSSPLGAVGNSVRVARSSRASNHEWTAGGLQPPLGAAESRSPRSAPVGWGNRLPTGGGPHVPRTDHPRRLVALAVSAAPVASAGPLEDAAATRSGLLRTGFYLRLRSAPPTCRTSLGMTGVSGRARASRAQKMQEMNMSPSRGGSGDVYHYELIGANDWGLLALDRRRGRERLRHDGA